MTEFNSKIKKNSRILKIFMFSICALFACAISSHAQSLVKGTVTDGIGEPLPGVSVVVKGTTNGTITDVNGKYSIQATAKTFYIILICWNVRSGNKGSRSDDH